MDTLEPMFRAIRRGEPAQLARLLAAGADPDRTYDGGDSLLSLCMTDYGPASAERLEVLELLLTAGVHPDAPYRSGTPPIFVWAAQGHRDAVARLREAGAELSGHDGKGRTLLLCAALGGLHGLIGELCHAGHDLGATGPQGRGALHYAADAWRWATPHLKPSPQTLSVLLAAGADPNASSDVGRPLHIAAESGRGEGTGLLLRAGADPHACTSAQVQPLHLAGLNGTPQSARRLLDAGADPDAKDCAGWTPLHYAAQGDQVEVAALLLDAGADPGLKSRAGRSIGTTKHGKNKLPADIARRFRRAALVALLSR